MKQHIIVGIAAAVYRGMKTTLRHVFQARKRAGHEGVKKDRYFGQQDGLVTIQYPKERIPVPEVGRYQLEVEMDDCIVCDLCAKVCPVDCIEIDAIKAVEDLGTTSDGSRKRLHAAKFDIDMAKCMYCGLCTTVCPTECIIMTDTYDKSVGDVAGLNYRFATMSPEEAEEKRRLLAESRK